MTNPFLTRDLSLAAAAAENDIERDIALAGVRLEHKLSPQDQASCEKCGKAAHYRPTIGSYQCPDGHVRSLSGQWR
jgi:hypothetical protein